jgi:type II secretory pathway pseudopilin PulG
MQRSKIHNEGGFSLAELTVAMGVMLIVTGAAFSLMKSAMKVSQATYELTDAQENLRTAHEFIDRDLMNAGDGLNSLSSIRVTSSFLTNYITKSTGLDPTSFGMLTSDNDVPSGTTIAQPSPTPATTIRSTPALTDRISILAQDRAFTPVTPAVGGVDSTGTNITLVAGDEAKFHAGEIYFLTSSAGATFCTITGITGAGTGTPKLVFANGDTYGLNVTGASGNIRTIANGSGTSLLRMQIIHYYINSSGLLMRRVFGVKNAGFVENPVAEHIVTLQFRYILNSTDANGNVYQPVRQLTTAQQTATRQVEITVTAETPHVIEITQNSGQPQTSMTTSISVRNLQFKQALQPS